MSRSLMYKYGLLAIPGIVYGAYNGMIGAENYLKENPYKEKNKSWCFTPEPIRPQIYNGSVTATILFGSCTIGLLCPFAYLYDPELFRYRKSTCVDRTALTEEVDQFDCKSISSVVHNWFQN